MNVAGCVTYQPGIEGPMGECATAILDIVEEVVRDLENTLAHNILVRPV